MSVSKPPDQMDQLLRTFFQAQVPKPWPELTLPAEAPVSGRRPLRYSRMALAASLLLLFIGQFWVSGFTSQPAPADLYPPRFEATNRHQLKRDVEKANPVQPGRSETKSKPAKVR